MDQAGWVILKESKEKQGAELEHSAAYLEKLRLIC